LPPPEPVVNTPAPSPLPVNAFSAGLAHKEGPSKAIGELLARAEAPRKQEAKPVQVAVAPADAPVGPACQKLGTAVNFFPSPKVAAQQAEANQKLLFTLHVSGFFEDDEFT